MIKNNYCDTTSELILKGYYFALNDDTGQTDYVSDNRKDLMQLRRIKNIKGKIIPLKEGA